MATACAGRHDGTTWVPSSSSCRSGCRLTASRRCRRSRTRTCAGWRRPPTATGPTPRPCTTRSSAPSSSRPRATAAPMAVRAFNPTLAEHGYEPRRLGASRPTPRTCPFLVDSVSAELAGPRPAASSACCTRSSASSATATARIARVLHPREAPRRESVMHFELDRRLTPEELADLEDARAPGAGRRAPRRARLPGDARARRGRWSSSRATAPRATTTTRSTRSSPSSSGCARQLRLPRRARVRDRRRRAARRARLRPRAPRRRGALGLRQAGARSRRSTRACASGRSTASCCWSPRPTGSSPVHRRARMDYVGVRRVSADGEIVGEARMLGLFTTKAYAEPASETPLLHRKLQPDPGQRGPDRGLARLQGRGRALRLLPQGRAVRRARPTTCAARSSRCWRLQADAGARCSGAATPTGAPRRSSSRCPRARYDAGAARAPARPVLRRRFDASTVDAHEVLDEGDRVRVHFTRPPRPGRPARASSRRELEARSSSSRARGTTALRDELVARHGEERGRHARHALGRAPARAPTRRPSTPAAAADDIALLRAAGHRRRGRSSSACSNERRRAHARRRSTSAATRSSSPRRCRCSRTSGCA